MKLGLLLLLGAFLLCGCAHGSNGCEAATVVAVGDDIDLPAQRTPTPYLLGGNPTAPPLPKGAKPLPHGLVPLPDLPAGRVASDTELSDGHVYRLDENIIDAAFDCAQRACYSAGQVVRICAVQSKLSGRLYYRIDNKPVNREL